METITESYSQTIDISSPETISPASHSSSYFSSNTFNTQATTPGGITTGGYHTIIITTKDLGSIKAIERAFVEFEPFKNFRCAFCSSISQITCKCQALETVDAAVPATKKKLLRYLEQEEVEASHIQAAILAYLLVLEKHIPFGIDFNLDQQGKSGVMHQQLEDVKHRISDMKRALELLDSDRSLVPGGILGACHFFRPVLANCLGNARENHICFKLNFKLFTK